MSRALPTGLIAAWCAVVAALGAWRLFDGGPAAWAGLGLLLAGGAPAAFIAWDRWKKPQRDERHPVGISVLCGIGVCIAMVVAWRWGERHEPNLMLAGSALIAWFAWVRWVQRAPGAP